MSKKINFVIITTAVVILSAIGLQIKRSFFDSAIAPLPAVNIANPAPTATPEIITAKLTDEQKNLLKEYLQQNLSLLSPKPEALGGKFYLTEFVILDNETADIAYEDGHISLAAKIKFTFIDGLPKVTGFVLTKDN